MPGLVPGIHVFTTNNTEDADGRDEPGHDANQFRPLPNSMTPRTATLIGLTAIVMWSLLAVLTVATGKIPAFQLAAMTFAVGALVGFLTWIRRPGAARALRQAPPAGVAGGGRRSGPPPARFFP